MVHHSAIHTSGLPNLFLTVFSTQVDNVYVRVDGFPL